MQPGCLRGGVREGIEGAPVRRRPVCRYLQATLNLATLAVSVPSALTVMWTVSVTTKFGADPALIRAKTSVWVSTTGNGGRALPENQSPPTPW